MTSLSPRPSNRLDWVSLWARYDDLTPQLPFTADTGIRPDPHWHVSSRARQEIETLVESMIADREGALNP